jgi:hypothetical protein
MPPAHDGPCPLDQETFPLGHSVGEPPQDPVPCLPTCKVHSCVRVIQLDSTKGPVYLLSLAL